MNEKTIDSSADGCLILILPIALLIIFLFATWPLLLALVVVGASWNIWQRYQWQRWSQQVNPIFHQMIRENQGSITALDLAMKANLPATTAKQYLDTKAEEFGAQRQDYKDQGTVYYFITASTLGSILDESEPPTLPENDEGRRRQTENQGKLLPGESSNPPTPGEGQSPISLKTNAAETPLEQSESPQAQQPTSESLLQPEDESERFKDEGGRIKEEQKETFIHPSSLISDPAEDSNQSTPTADPEEQATSLTSDTAKTPSEQTEPPNHTQAIPQLLLQSELAKRLDVHSSTVYKHRDDPDFPEWSRSKDPKGIAWKFLPDTKEFAPLENEPE